MAYGTRTRRLQLREQLWIKSWVTPGPHHIPYYPCFHKDPLRGAVVRMISIAMQYTLKHRYGKGESDMQLTELVVPTFTQLLKTLAGWLTKAQAQMAEADADALLSARLAPDMFPLTTQVRFVCKQVFEAVSRLRGEAFGEIHEVLLEEGRNASGRPGSIADAIARIDEAQALLKGLAPGALDERADHPIAHEIPNGMIFDLTAEQYARDWVLPQFYFHLMAAYAILRSEGVELGKADYVPYMFQYIRPGTMPQA